MHNIILGDFKEGGLETYEYALSSKECSEAPKLWAVPSKLKQTELRVLN